jgi:hypothetical protein
MSGRRQRTISLARSVAMFLVRKTAKLSFPEIGMRMGKRNHSTVISACRRIERAVHQNEMLAWTSASASAEEEAPELIQRLEEHSRTTTTRGSSSAPSPARARRVRTCPRSDRRTRPPPRAA